MKNCLLLLAALLLPVSARASCHLMEIVEIFAGTDADPDAQYVVLRMTAAGQNYVQLSTVETTTDVFGTFPSTLPPNGALGDLLLMATTEAQAMFSITADGTASGTLEFPDGSVLFNCGGIWDTVKYGAVAGSEAPALVRGCALKKSGATWSLGDPAPGNNAGDSASLSTCVAPDGGFPEPTAHDMGTSDLGAEDANGSEGEAEGEAEGEDDDGGCGCRIASSTPTTSGLGALLAIAAMALRRRS